MGKVGKFSWLPNSPVAPFAKLLPAKAQKSYVYLSESGHFYVLRISSGWPLQPPLMWPPPLGHSLWPRFVSALCVLSRDEGMASLFKHDLIDHSQYTLLPNMHIKNFDLKKLVPKTKIK